MNIFRDILLNASYIHGCCGDQHTFIVIFKKIFRNALMKYHSLKNENIHYFHIKIL
jgi:hypothetical protein